MPVDIRMNLPLMFHIVLEQTTFEKMVFIFAINSAGSYGWLNIRVAVLF